MLDIRKIGPGDEGFFVVGVFFNQGKPMKNKEKQGSRVLGFWGPRVLGF